MRKILFTALSVLALFAISCSSDKDAPRVNDEPNEPLQLTIEQEAINKAEINMAIDIFEEMFADADNQDNIMFSPLSKDLCLSIMSNVVDDDSKKTIMEKYGASSATALNEYNRSRMEYFSYNGSKAKVAFANSIWANTQTMKSESDFTNATKDIVKYYNAEQRLLDFGTKDIKGLINNWCSDKTNGLIPKFLDEEPDNTTQSIFINAMYFDCSWKSPFAKSGDEIEKFYKPDGISRACGVHYMSSIRSVPATVNDDYSAFSMAYANCNYSAIFVLPNTDKTIKDIIPQINDILVCEDLKKESIYPCSIKIPRFTTNYTKDLQGYITNSGIDFDNMELSGYGKMASSIIRQATMLSLSEEGTKAAASTGGMTGTALSTTKIHLDRPFLMIVKDDNTATILLLAAIQYPK